ncbi:MAG: glycosyl hydrolase-related protein [Lachnospiraceae bacterium]|nr:glycosyl hydrolase-related protein [Lachnospiraceae bacterium]
METGAGIDDAVPDTNVYHRMRAEETLDFANAFYHLKVDSLGRITSLVDLQTEYEYAAGSLNEWKLYQDVNVCYDAWELGSMYESIPVKLTGEHFSTVETKVDGSLLLTVKRKEQYFSAVQKVYLKKDSPRIDFVTEIDWHERHRILKADFPTSVFTKEVLEEIPFGYIRRPTHRSTGQEKDMYETCHHRYAVLTDGENGFALLNDCKYGLSAENSRLSLTLLRAPVQPDVTANQGVHRFTYSILPFHGSFADSCVTEEAYELNTVVTECAETRAGNIEVHGGDKKNAEKRGTDKVCAEKVRKYDAGVAALDGEHVSYFGIEGCHVILETCKPAFDLENGVVLRLYESKGSAGIAMLQVPATVKHIYSCNMLEHISEELELTAEHRVKLRFRAFEIKTLLLTV